MEIAFAKASAVSAWARAYSGLTLNQPNPARIAAFKIATRNLANNIHVPFDRIMQLASDRLGSNAQDAPDEEQLGADNSPRE
jgi:hypothetical protein